MGIRNGGGAVFFACLLTASLSLARSDEKQNAQQTHQHQRVWLVGPQEAQMLAEQAQQSLDVLFQAVADYESNFPLQIPAQRGFSYDDGQQTRNLERAAVSRILVASLDVATVQAANFAACGSTCSRHEQFNEPESNEELQARKTLWHVLPRAKQWAFDKFARTKDLLLETFVQRRQVASYLMGQANYYRSANGLAATALVGFTFPIYTFISEKIETLLVGPVHMFCKASALGYFRVVNTMIGTVQGAMDAKSFLNESDAAINRAQIAWEILQMRIKVSKNIRRVLFPTLLSGVVEAISRKGFDKDLGQKLAHQNDLVAKTAQGSLWPDLVEQFFRPQLQQIDANQLEPNPSLFLDDIGFILSDAEALDKSMRASEMISFFRVVKDVLRNQAFYRQAAGMISKTQMTQVQANLGQMDRILDKIQYVLSAMAVLPPNLARRYLPPDSVNASLYQTITVLQDLHHDLDEPHLVEEKPKMGKFRRWAGNLWRRITGRPPVVNESKISGKIAKLHQDINMFIRSGMFPIQHPRCVALFSANTFPVLESMAAD